MKSFILPIILALGLAISGNAATAQTPAAPDFTGIDHWINSPPLTIAGLHGKVVLVDFWAYSCINCVRAMPHVEHLYETYRDKGLVVVGVHSPEFDFEKNPANVQDAVRRMGITYPIAMDSELGTWNAWHNQYWPAEYLVDQNGQVIGHQYGEGGYLRMENAIRLLLGMNTLPGSGDTAGLAPDADDTPELHLGSLSQSGLDSSENGHDGLRRYSAPAQLAPNSYALTGLWEIADEYARLAGSQGDLQLRFKAAKLYMVASADKPVTLEITVDGKSETPVTVQGSRLYTLFDSHADRWHLLKLHIPEKGVKIYSFTFG